VAGMTLAGVAQSPPVLFGALLVAGASAGLVFPPFSDVVAGRLSIGVHGRVLSAISSGTGLGVALAAPVAMVAGADWRAAWFLFALIAALATGWALVVLPGRQATGESPGVLLPSLSWFVCPRSGPLLGGALLVGLSSSVVWTFGVDHLVTEGGLSPEQSRIFLGVVGLATLGGGLGGDAVRRLGGRATFAAAVAAEAAALLGLGLAPTHLSAAFVSAVLFGASYGLGRGRGGHLEWPGLPRASLGRSRSSDGRQRDRAAGGAARLRSRGRRDRFRRGLRCRRRAAAGRLGPRPPRAPRLR